MAETEARDLEREKELAELAKPRVKGVGEETAGGAKD